MISVVIITKNAEKHIEKTLNSISFFDEVLILDSGSTDSTLSIAKDYSNVVVHQSLEFVGYGQFRNKAAQFAKNDWILALDADEVVSEQLATTILSRELDVDSVYSMPFYNYFNNRKIKWCGWYPDRHIRLYNKNKTQFSNDLVHEGIIIDNVKEVFLNDPIYHYSYSSISDFITKMQHYSDLFANQNKGKKSSSLLKAIGHAFFAFIKSYFIQRGFLGGYEGFVISAYNAHTAYYKYLKLHEINKTCDKCS